MTLPTRSWWDEPVRRRVSGFLTVPGRLLVLALDAFEPTLIRRWTADGTLPAIRALMERGISGSVRGVEGFYVGSTWPSFYTGLNPAGHGFYRVDQVASGRYDVFQPLDSPAGIAGTPIWRLASDAGRRVAALDVPLTRVEPDLNGIHVSGWGGFEYEGGFETWPPALAGEVLSMVGEHPVSGAFDRPRASAEEFAELATALELGVARRTELALALLERDDWDLFIQVLMEGHCAGHQCWHFHDPTHPAHDSQMSLATDPVERVYRAADRAVGTIVEQAGDARILLFSLHGMRSFCGADFLLPQILYRLGVTVPTVQVPRLHELLYRSRLTDNPAYRSVRRRLGRSASTSAPPLNVSEWADAGASRCFPVPNSTPVSGIRLNLVGREPQGVLRPGPETDTFCEQLSRDLLAIVDDRTGSPLVAAVQRTDSMYAGARLDALPDLLVTWSDAVATGTLAHAGGRGATIRARSETIGVLEGQNEYHRTGEHIASGFFAFAGPGVPVAAIPEPVGVLDFYPTICSLLDLAPPAVDGNVIPEIVACC